MAKIPQSDKMTVPQYLELRDPVDALISLIKELEREEEEQFPVLKSEMKQFLEEKLKKYSGNTQLRVRVFDYCNTKYEELIEKNQKFR